MTRLRTSRAAVGAIVAAALVVAALLTVTAVRTASPEGRDEPTARSANSTTAPESPDTAPTESASPEPGRRDGDGDSGRARPDRSASGPTEPVPAASGTDVRDRVRVRPQRLLDPVPSTEDVVVADRVRVRIQSLRITRAEAKGPGEIAGRALAVTVRLHNTSDRPFPLAGAAVTALDADEAPLAVLVSPKAVAPFAGRVPARGHRDATYLFQLPQEHPTPITVNVSPAPGLPVAVLVGDPS